MSVCLAGIRFIFGAEFGSERVSNSDVRSGKGEKGSRNGDGWIDGRLNPTGGTWGKGGMIATVNGMESTSPLSH